jgi:2-isopropylmalate synthase
MGYDLSDDELKTVFKQFKDPGRQEKNTSWTKTWKPWSPKASCRRRHLLTGIPARHLRYHGHAHGQRETVHQRPQGQGANYGNGPIDSAFNTIAKLTNTSPNCCALPSAP